LSKNQDAKLIVFITRIQGSLLQSKTLLGICSVHSELLACWNDQQSFTSGNLQRTVA